MSFMNSLFDLFFGTATSYEGSSPFSTGCDSTQMDAINPANGLPMVGGEGGIDVAGNPYGCDNSDWHSGSMFDDSGIGGCGSGIDSDSFGCGAGLDDW